ncbi:MAG: hypothetical protein ACE5OP_12830 [Candidatus Glassbacteria bacterium]
MSRRGLVIVANAIIWAAVILASAVVLQGTEYFGQMLPILGGGAGGSIIVLGGGLRRAGER